ncbi:MAG TPA: C40 family peptidase [Chitinophagales bacterium]|nr:C40 family peptidase [Chitinophagales bacterium]HNK74486.1 C40 family peptidase [Chitinophagales bacterium]
MLVLNNIKITTSIFVIACMLFIQPAFAKKKKKDKAKTDYNFTSKNRDSVWRKVVPFDLSNTTFTALKSNNIDGILWFAKQQLGTPYKYASADPKNGGLDCSGFLFYVYTHFKIKVPRTSKDYMNFGKSISTNKIQKGDVLIFTGSDASQKIAGHVGMVIDTNDGEISFIHGASGKGKGVTISKLSESYYTTRFLKAVRIVN